MPEQKSVKTANTSRRGVTEDGLKAILDSYLSHLSKQAHRNGESEVWHLCDKNGCKVYLMVVPEKFGQKYPESSAQ